MTQPTAAAMRYGALVHPDVPGLATLVGTVVDDVTGLPELIAAATDVVEFLDSIRDKYAEPDESVYLYPCAGESRDGLDAHKRLKAALRIANRGRKS